MGGDMQAFVTLATNDTYCMGALVMAHSLRNVQTSKQIVVLITSEVSEKMRNLLEDVFDVVKLVEVVKGPSDKDLIAYNRPEWGVCMTKILCWRLTEYSKCVYMDSDAIAIKNCDELFEYPELSACPDIGWPDIFNSGLFVFEPSEKTYQELYDLCATGISFDSADQGLLNCYFSNWFNEKEKHLSFIYNTGTLATYSYTAAFKRFGHKSKIIHFLGGIKPWEYGYNPETKDITQPPGTRPTQLKEHLELWWNIFLEYVYPHLNKEMNGMARHFSCVDLKSGPKYQGIKNLSKKQGTVYFARTHFPAAIDEEKTIGG